MDHQLVALGVPGEEAVVITFIDQERVDLAAGGIQQVELASIGGAFIGVAAGDDQTPPIRVPVGLAIIDRAVGIVEIPNCAAAGIGDLQD